MVDGELPDRNSFMSTVGPVTLHKWNENCGLDGLEPIEKGVRFWSAAKDYHIWFGVHTKAETVSADSAHFRVIGILMNQIRV